MRSRISSHHHHECLDLARKGWFEGEKEDIGSWFFRERLERAAYLFVFFFPHAGSVWWLKLFQMEIFCVKKSLRFTTLHVFIRIVLKKRMFYKIFIVLSTIKYKKHINQKLILHSIRCS